ncbi:MAG TPA: hypothetical protein VIN39_09915 [Candidatus Dormibacteraeota bacterium]|jgi:hypothetical protein
MSTMQSLLNNIAAAGSLYGWRLDAILLGSLLWAITISAQRLLLTFR